MLPRLAMLLRFWPLCMHLFSSCAKGWNGEYSCTLWEKLKSSWLESNTAAMWSVLTLTPDCLGNFIADRILFFSYVAVLVDIESLQYGQQCFSNFPLLFWETLCPWLMSFAVQLDHRKKPLSCCISSWRVTVCDCHGEKERIDDSHGGRLGPAEP